MCASSSRAAWSCRGSTGSVPPGNAIGTVVQTRSKEKAAARESGAEYAVASSANHAARHPDRNSRILISSATEAGYRAMWHRASESADTVSSQRQPTASAGCELPPALGSALGRRAAVTPPLPRNNDAAAPNDLGVSSGVSCDIRPAVRISSRAGATAAADTHRAVDKADTHEAPACLHSLVRYRHETCRHTAPPVSSQSTCPTCRTVSTSSTSTCDPWPTSTSTVSPPSSSPPSNRTVRLTRDNATTSITRADASTDSQASCPLPAPQAVPATAALEHSQASTAAPWGSHVARSRAMPRSSAAVMRPDMAPWAWMST
mmetsp:Transcript_25205/g.58025  ORF Transcript_25205/g.58025 Transcript_25205/m.58025 type:complete len:318 (+) Transcript_25205:1269-2222(+)